MKKSLLILLIIIQTLHITQSILTDYDKKKIKDQWENGDDETR
jgi:hypothetical protein